METLDLAEINNQNETEYDGLIVSIEANERLLNLLIAVCDDLTYRDKIIDQYEKELRQQNIPCYQITLPKEEPSLRRSIANLVEQKKCLQEETNAVITVTGAEKLRYLSLNDERSEQEVFLGYLQWTREALRRFPFTIILWVTKQLEIEISKKAPDFWSWRKGVFRFISKKTVTVPIEELNAFTLELNNIEEEEYLLPLEDLQALVEQVEETKGNQDASLITLYNSLGKVYKNRTERGESQNYKEEQDKAIEYYLKALDLYHTLNKEHDLEYGLIISELAEIYQYQGKYTEAESLFLKALDLRKRLLGDNHPDVAESFDNLAIVYESQERYTEAESLFLEALDLRKTLLGDNHPDVAQSINNIAGLYESQKRYTEAESLFLEALDLRKRLSEDNHHNVAQTLNNLAGLYQYQGRYTEAEPLYLEALDLIKSLLGNNHPHVATTLNNLASLYKSQKRYKEAEPLYLEALNLIKSLLGNSHPDFATTLNNLASLYESQERYTEAEPLYLEALEMAEKTLGKNHLDTFTIRNNLASMRKKLNIQENLGCNV
ncbi:tetratricopeptide repeat protein [Crocosphaera sp. UHCC 0190]|uniref:tetratricopeptide repeat protein n=1 Tax=Crocosphaera sp. UHCC 0190 TaxID=3110246 RepID=UPI002B212B4F|nr:tetratricopeptide repeat protein [Crocosphaera sp. UHCC 0190]MEA5509280.1 tetratricopeptide repeat protein [Crocosphaera sp. UHCC 0190]